MTRERGAHDPVRPAFVHFMRPSPRGASCPPFGLAPAFRGFPSAFFCLASAPFGFASAFRGFASAAFGLASAFSGFASAFSGFASAFFRLVTAQPGHVALQPRPASLPARDHTQQLRQIRHSRTALHTLRTRQEWSVARSVPLREGTGEQAGQLPAGA